MGLVDAFFREFVEGVEDDLLDLLRVFGGDVFQAGSENAFAVVVLETTAVSHRCAKPRVDQRFAQRRPRVAHQDFGQHLHRELLERVAGGHGNPGDERLGFALDVVA